ncbi:hypothetical protein N7470_009421 [Penicillium chermesinum]|nr:hypothetical protein N7470_009421 [Penicillium chermesinum]
MVARESAPRSKRRSARLQGDDQYSKASVATERQPLMLNSPPSSPASKQPRVDDCRPFAEKYGRMLEILHYGTNSTIRLHQFKPRGPREQPQLCAVKVYRNDILSSRSNPLPHASACSTTFIADLHPYHPNILPIIDLLYNDRAELCLVTPFCAVQILRALAFLHEHQTAHRDVRLETVLLTGNGCVKLAGFGDGHVCRIWEKCMIASDEEEDSPQTPVSPASGSWSLPWFLAPFSRGNGSRRGSSGDTSSTSATFPGMSLPFIPPEAFHPRQYKGKDPSHSEEHSKDPRPADVWAAAVIYLVLINGRLPWRSARPHHEDSRFEDYLACRCSEDGYPLIEALGCRRRNAIYAMLHPVPRKRLTAKQMLRTEWMTGVFVCEAGETGL